MKASDARALLERKYKDEIDDVMEGIYTDIENAIELHGLYSASWSPSEEQKRLVINIIRKLEANGYIVNKLNSLVMIYW
jgi:hypothetical protein